jgi:hypothetical protein
MNNRIKELAEQVGMHDFVLEAMGISEEFEKFAELILQDIDKIVDNLYHSLPLEQAAVLLTLDENIKEHFYGVDK